MTSKRLALVLGILGLTLCALAAAPLSAQTTTATPITRLNTGTLVQSPNLVLGTWPCSMTGIVKLDPNDHTNGATWYKGTLTFTAKIDLTGVMMYPHGLPYGCDGNEAFLTGVLGFANLSEPDAKFTANQSRSYSVRCATKGVVTSGSTANTSIKWFVGGNPGWSQKSGDCSGKHTFMN